MESLKKLDLNVNRGGSYYAEKTLSILYFRQFMIFTDSALLAIINNKLLG